MNSFLRVLVISSLSCRQVISFTPCHSYTSLRSIESKSFLQVQNNNDNDNNSSSSENNENYRQDVDSMRRMLESSWKEESMGSVPTTPQRAASNAAESVLSALSSSDQSNGLFLVDISLPSMDPMSGENIYDDIGAAEFCIEFAERLNENRKACQRLQNDGGVSIVVKDESLVTKIERFTKLGKTSSTNEADEVLYDDFADFDGGNSFHGDESDANDSIDSSVTKNISLKCILGKNKIERDKNMINEVVKSMTMNGSPNENDDVIIILAPISQQELVGVRWLVSKYGCSKTIVIFNNKLNPLPNELMMAETCYSVFPLIARSSTSPPPPTAPPSQSEQQPNQPVNPKIVLLRRFPRDWEIHIDANEGSGFELAGSVPAGNVGMRGPSMDWIAGCVKQHMQSKFGK